MSQLTPPKQTHPIYQNFRQTLTYRRHDTTSQYFKKKRHISMQRSCIDSEQRLLSVVRRP